MDTNLVYTNVANPADAVSPALLCFPYWPINEPSSFIPSNNVMGGRKTKQKQNQANGKKSQNEK